MADSRSEMLERTEGAGLTSETGASALSVEPRPEEPFGRSEAFDALVEDIRNQILLRRLDERLYKLATGDVLPIEIAFVEGTTFRQWMAQLRAHPHVRPGGRVVAKHFWRDPPPSPPGLLASGRERRFGETTLTFYRRAQEASEA